MSVHATARIVATPAGLPVLTGEGPLALRRTRATGAGARVTVVGAMSAPLGGDRLAIEADVRDGARLIVDAAAATVALPGRPGPVRAEPAHYDVRLTVGEGAELHWLPEQLISAYGSDLRMRTRVELAATARLVLRDEQILGRHGEGPGTLLTRLTVHRAGRPLLDQELAHGPGAADGWDGGAILGGYRAVGQLLLVGQEFEEKPVEPRLLGDTAVLTPLAGPGALVTAVAPDALRLRRVLDEVLRAHQTHGSVSAYR
ncbi:urease accessory protein UreD [Streptomyces scopuliridis]|uniref:Urease accessory protein UreD n=1 Tax=Streptomyces scopuliridis TaxID=452529 RepID=A0ACD4ZWU0_9ACTN|nr:urease accessory protein UreD [Streptomyces scopuliridis]WSB37111.1 urease accessory protein UreD [Streptomyces scopuliridis]WSC01507.1 urease accessory protein UreD [Streptomyces scopuliridis]WSC04956.1 urease accessory protein UreD [Streptomyces scopuliridis]